MRAAVGKTHSRGYDYYDLRHGQRCVRVSDAERESVAAQLRDAATEGRLTLAEADERPRSAYPVNKERH